MRFFAVAALAALAVADITSLETRDKSCVKGVHVIGLGGQGTTQGDLGYLQTLVGNITRAIPHSNFAQIGYPAGALGPQAIPYAIPLLHQHIMEYSARCPHTRIVIAAYSVGGAVDMDTLCGSPQTGADALPDRYKKNILANVVYGDLTFIPGRSYNRGTCKHNHGLVPREHPAACFPYGKKTHSYCDHGDVNCCSGNNEAVHFEYPQKYDLKATAWVVHRWQRYQKNLRHGRP